MSLIKSASQYHRQTEYTRDRTLGRGMDWSNQPTTLKVYPDAQTVALPRELTLPRIEGPRSLLQRFHRQPEVLDIDNLARLLYMSYGFTASVDHGAQTFYYRSAPSAGALYPIDIYVAAEGMNDLADGLYYYNLEEFALKKLSSDPPPAIIKAPSILLSALFFRSAWKYGDRAFRYCLLDCGHVMENIDLISPTLGLEADIKADFNDNQINDYLNFDPARERSMSLITLGRPSAADTGRQPDESSMQVLKAEPVAPDEETFELIDSVGRLTSAPLSDAIDPPLSLWPQGASVPLSPPDLTPVDGPSLVQVLQKRRSRRNFKPQVLEKESLNRVLSLITSAGISRFLNLSLVISSFKDLPDGYYRYRPSTHDLEMVKGGFLSPAVSKAALGQDWIGRANLIMVLSSPLKALEEALGPRSLRLAYLNAGRLGQRAYLAAEALEWGACGVGAFFDNEVRQALDTPPNEEILYLIPIGPVKKRTHGGRPSAK